MRLDKLLSEMGVGSRSEIKKTIRSGKVSVNGAITKDPGLSVSTDMEIRYQGKSVSYEAYSYFMLHKPAGVISASEDRKQKTVIDLISSDLRRKDLFPVGRLDKDTEGLLLITNDGQLSHQLLSPKHHVDKLYYAHIDGIVTDEDVQKFTDGLYIDDELTCLPATLRILKTSPEEGSSEIEIIIQEGKFHQVKRMFQAVGKEVTYLKRLSMGTLKLDPSLAPGEYRRLTDEELKLLQSLR